MLSDNKKEAYFEGIKNLLDIIYHENLAKINASSEYSEKQKQSMVKDLQKDYTNVKSVIENTKNLTDIQKQLNNSSFRENRFITKQELQEMFARNARY